MTAYFADIARQAAADGVISAEEILALRSAGWADGVMQPEEVDAIFELNDALPEPTPEWSDFFVDAIGVFVINGIEPKGYVSEANARWLMDRIDHDGTLQGMTELQLLVRVFELSFNVPDALKAYVLKQVEDAVMTGTGPTRQNGDLEAGCINAAEAAILRRVLFARAGDGPASISLGEAEFLFRLKDATLGTPNAPEWKRLFVQGVGNYLMGTPPKNSQISREREMELQAKMADTRSSVLGFLGKMVKQTPDTARVMLGTDQSVKRDLLMAEVRRMVLGDGRDRLVEMREGERITPEEQAWLDSQVDADGAIDEYEQALIDFTSGAAA